jgi:MFS family permease
MPAALRSLTRDQWLFFAAFLTWGFGLGLWINLQPLYLQQLGANPQQVGAALSLAGLSAVFLYIPAGLVADRGRHKQMIVAAWIVGTVAVLAIGLAPDWRWAIPGFALYLLSSFARPATSSFITAVDRSGNVSRSFAILSSGFSIGHILSPALGGWVAEAWGLRAVFILATGVCVLSTLAVARLSNLPLPPAARRGQTRELMSDRSFLWQVFVLLIVFFALDVGVVLLPNYLQDAKGLNLEQIGQLGSLSALGMFVFMLLLGSLRSERRTSLLLTQLVIGASLVLCLAAPAAAGAFHPLLLFGMLLRGADKAAWPITRGRLSRWLQPRVLSLGFGVLDTASQIALTVSPLVAGALYARAPELPLMAGAVALAGAMLLTLTLRRVSLAPPEVPVLHKP